MIQMTPPSNKPKRVSVIRDFPYGCGTWFIQNQRSENGGEVVPDTSEIPQDSIGSRHSCVDVANRDYNRRPTCSVDRLNEVESIDVILKKAGFNVAANSNVGRGGLVSSYGKFPPSCGSKVKPLSSEETMRLIASQSRRRQTSGSSTNIQRKLVKAVENQRNLPEKSNATALIAKTNKPNQNKDERRSKQLPVVRQNQITKVLSPREKVLRALRLFKLLFEVLARDKAAGESKTATNKIHYETLAILRREGIQVNAEKMIGPVPGIEIGDEFQYKSELNLIGLHFDIRGGIDYINRGNLTLATCIISSEGNGYMDRFNSDVMIYSGQGGNLTSKDPKVMEDQKLVTGNLALANSMREQTPVRVIFGKKRMDERGKRYVYDGLYLVKDYWKDRGPGGNIMFKFELSRVPGQPSTNVRH